MKFEPMTFKLEQMDGLRIPVATVVDMIALGMTNDEILVKYPD